LSEEERAKVMVRGGKMDFFRTLRTCWRISWVCMPRACCPIGQKVSVFKCGLVCRQAAYP